MDRIRGHLTPASQPGGQRSGQTQGEKGEGMEATTGRKGTAMRGVELQLARDRINREKSFIRETSQVFTIMEFLLQKSTPKNL